MLCTASAPSPQPCFSQLNILDSQIPDGCFWEISTCPVLYLAGGERVLLLLSQLESESPGFPRPEKEWLQLQPRASSRMESWAGPVPGLPCAACTRYCPKRVDSGCVKVPEAWEAQPRRIPHSSDVFCGAN